MAEKEKKATPDAPQHAPTNYRLGIDGDPVKVTMTERAKLNTGEWAEVGDTIETTANYAHDLIRHGKAKTAFTDEELAQSQADAPPSPYADEDEEDVEEKDENTGEIKTVRRKKSSNRRK